MGKAGTGFSMSLDGFLVMPKGDVGALLNWYFLATRNFGFRVAASRSKSRRRAPIWL